MITNAFNLRRAALRRKPQITSVMTLSTKTGGAPCCDVRLNRAWLIQKRESRPEPPMPRSRAIELHANLFTNLFTNLVVSSLLVQLRGFFFAMASASSISSSCGCVSSEIREGWVWREAVVDSSAIGLPSTVTAVALTPASLLTATAAVAGKHNAQLPQPQTRCSGIGWLDLVASCETGEIHRRTRAGWS